MVFLLFAKSAYRFMKKKIKTYFERRTTMKVKTNIFEKVLLQFSRLMSSLSFTIGQSIYRKHDPKGIFNSWSYDKTCNEITFSKEEEES